MKIEQDIEQQPEKILEPEQPVPEEGHFEQQKLENEKILLTQFRADKDKEKQDHEVAIEWYRKAKVKADEFIAKIDPAYTVKVGLVNIRLIDGSFVQDCLVLDFNHAENNDLSWSMSIGMDDDYLNNTFESVVKNGYSKMVSGEKEDSFVNRENYEDINRDFDNKELAEIEEKERGKNDIELEMIDTVNGITDRIRARFGLEGIFVPYKAIHIIKKADWSETGGNACYVERLKAILIKDSEKLLILKKKLVHEMLHFKSSNILPTFLNEAVIEQMTIEGVKATDGDLSTLLEYRQSKGIISKYGKHRDKNGDLLFGQETFLAYVGRDENLHAVNFGYPEERRLLGDIIDTIYAKSNGIYFSRDEVMNVFAKACFTGDSKPLEIIDQIFGAGTLEKLRLLKDVSGAKKVLGI